MPRATVTNVTFSTYGTQTACKSTVGNHNVTIYADYAYYDETDAKFIKPEDTNLLHPSTH